MSIDLYGVPSSAGIGLVLGGTPNAGGITGTVYFGFFNTVNDTVEANVQFRMPRAGVFTTLLHRSDTGSSEMDFNLVVNGVVQQPTIIIPSNSGAKNYGPFPLGVRTTLGDTVSLQLKIVGGLGSTLFSWATAFV